VRIVFSSENSTNMSPGITRSYPPKEVGFKLAFYHNITENGTPGSPPKAGLSGFLHVFGRKGLIL
jgi:hypothetical protein